MKKIIFFIVTVGCIATLLSVWLPYFVVGFAAGVLMTLLYSLLDKNK